MSTTDAHLGSHVLEALRAAAFDFAFLHHESDVAAGGLVGDYDLVVDASSADDVLRRALWAARTTGLRAIASSEYDSGSVSLWLSTRTADDGVQLDFTFDRHGVNQLVHPIGAWLDSAIPGDHWPVVAAEFSLQYRTRKAALKQGDWRTPTSLSRTLAESRRIARRVRTPAGFWVHLEAGRDLLELGATVATRFARIIPLAFSAELPEEPVRRLDAWRHLVPPTVLRPGLVITYGSLPRGPRPHLLVPDASDPDVLGDAISAAMASRLAARYGGDRTCG